MKKYYLILGIFILFSCEDILEQDPIVEITEAQVFDNEEMAVLAVNGIYDALIYAETAPGSGFEHHYEFFIGDICTDDSEPGSSPSDRLTLDIMKEFSGSASTINNSRNLGFRKIWEHMFRVIFRANMVLQNLPNAKISENLKLELEGEARFLRGYAYFLLVKIYGGVPLFEKTVNMDDIVNRSISRASFSETYDFVETDFRRATEILPVKSSARELGRVNKGVAAAYLARTLLYRLGMADAEGKLTWQELYELTNDFIGGQYGNYALISNYPENFEAEGENNIESIFELQAAFFDAASAGDPATGATTGPRVVMQNPYDPGGKWQGWGFNIPTQNLVDSYETNDARRPTAAIAIDEFAYGSSLPDNERNYTGYFSRKAFHDPRIWGTESQKQSSKNQKRFRYAEILLINAEAAYHVGDFGKAIQNLSQLRDRASGSTYPKGFLEGDFDANYTPTGFAPLDNSIIPSTGQELLEFIWLERRRELAMEHLRFWDLVRTSRFLDIMTDRYQDIYPGIRGNIAERSIESVNSDGQTVLVPLFPIDFNDQINFGLEQNPGY